MSSYYQMLTIYRHWSLPVTSEVRASPSVAVNTASSKTLFICLLVNPAPVTGAPIFTAAAPSSCL